MEYTQKLRIKTAMIVYELELSLGNYVINNETYNSIAEPLVESIIARENEKGNRLGKDDFSLIIEASYLDEIFTFALKISEGTSYHRHMLELKQLCSLLGFFNIRNAVSHPNRLFPDSYWFRAATIASDPLIEKLNLTTVRNALNSAIEENLSTPPEEWLHNVSWAIPNTLPTSFDHEITGLLGRDKEFKDLETVLGRQRNNLVAVVAPGGIGKTALVLQYLKDISLSPIWTSKLSSILFCTLKNEKLTANGIEPINAISGILEIKNSILEDLKTIYPKHELESFEDALEVLEDEKILICIDNLETLLIVSQKEFIELHQLLPLKWRLLVTSRISIDSATTVPLEPLGKRHAVNLCRSYLRKRGVLDFTQENLEKIADAANNNPLAIRLTIDLYLQGGDIIHSISRTQKDIASFSFKNLIESLKQNSIVLLEAIYAIGSPSKSELMDFLHLSQEDLIESINELAKTSLILRKTDEFGNDTYRLSDSIRDLLLTNPRNIEIRTSITEDIKKRKAKVLDQYTRIKQLGLSEFDDEFIPDGIDPNIYSLITDLNKVLSQANFATSGHNEITSIKDKLSNFIRYKPDDYLLLFNYSRIFRALKDTAGELTYLKQAEALKSDSPRIKLAIAKRYFHTNDYQESIDYFEKLHNMQFHLSVKSTKKFSYTVTKLNYLCLLYLGRYDKVLELTENWKNDANWVGVSGVSRATALKRKTEFKYNAIDNNTAIVEEILEILHYIFKIEGYFDAACVETNKIIKDLEFVINPAFNYAPKTVSQYLNFVATHFFNLISKLRGENINSQTNQEFIRRLHDFPIENNPLNSVMWFKSQHADSSYDKDHIQELKDEGFQIVRVYHIPEDRGYGISSFMFAENELKEQFYLSVTNFDQGWNGWGYIKEGELLAIKYESYKLSGKPTPASRIVEIDQY